MEAIERLRALTQSGAIGVYDAEQLLTDIKVAVFRIQELEETCTAMAGDAGWYRGVDEALDGMTPIEIESAQGLLCTTLVPSLAKLMFVALIKDDGSLWNYMRWDIGETPVSGPLRLTLERLEGKTAADLYQEARTHTAQLEADNAILRAERDVLRAACEALVAACDTAPPMELMKHISAACALARAALHGEG